MIFDLLGALEQRKIGGAPGAPPRPWQGFSDVALIRVNAILKLILIIGAKKSQIIMSAHFVILAAHKKMS